ncbi:hypothetical protein HanRHA438_Chr15g0724991 [Helianthus annuus]|nr:hypothetical protein HanHA89_Chr15g0631001 [Helianthus annuus]KAJ0650110.1 hypothetical protein HanLR1_Chr15g0591921 [Helianthus annuus]KAJ0653882.1 hypothetical protein HanOQP8_Chr15g0588581 [Helianthus annuus]KAJ0846450.1 hypothetical protein HanRHA438_Chr15g0724991 [Helianthus annuus]
MAKDGIELWPTLLDEVQARFDTDVGQLWFPFYLVLRPGCYEDTNGCSGSTRFHTSVTLASGT